MGIDPDYHYRDHYFHDHHDDQNDQVKEEEVVGHPRSFALFDSPARVPRADRFDPLMVVMMTMMMIGWRQQLSKW